MKFLNGFKTILGALGLVLTVAAPKVAPELIGTTINQVHDIALGVFGLLTTLGIVHKVEKAKDAEP